LNLPELPVNEGFSLSGFYSKLVARKVHLTKQFCHYTASAFISEEAPERTPLDISSDIFHVGETLLYTKDGHTLYVKVEEIFIADDSVLQFKVRPA